MNVAREMNHESQGVCLPARIARDTQKFDLLLEGIRDATGGVRAIFVKVRPCRSSWDIDEVPIAGFRMLAEDLTAAMRSEQILLTS